MYSIRLPKQALARFRVSMHSICSSCNVFLKAFFPLRNSFKHHREWPVRFDGMNEELANICNLHGLSQSDFLGIYQYLHAVLKFEEPAELLVLDNDIDCARSYFDQDQSFKPAHSLRGQIWGVHGYISIYQKSFYDAPYSSV